MNTISIKKGGVPLSLGTADTGKLLAQYAIPAIIAMIAAAIYNITDSIFIGHGVGHLALSGLAITFPVMNLLAAFAALVGVGSAALLSLRLGQKDYDAANFILGNVVTLNLIMTVFITVPLLIFLKPLLLFFGASQTILPYAYDFMIIIAAGGIVVQMNMSLNSLLRSSGHPKKSMYAIIVTVVLNLILNPLFIFGFKWGIRGSAAATVIAQFVVLAWQFYFFADKSNFIHFKSGIYKLKSSIVKGIFSIGLAPFLLNAAACVVVILINKQLSFHGGDLAVGAYGIINRTATLFVMIIFGINQGMQPIAGYNYGAKLYGRVSEVLKKSLVIAVLIMTGGFVIVEAFPHFVASLFTTNQELVSIAATGLRIVFLCFSFAGFQIVTSAFFQSIGKAYISIFLSVTRQVVFLIPLLIILPPHMGINGVWASMPIADFTAFLFCAVMIRKQFKKMRVMRPELPEAANEY